jgi:hypothetical protein
MEDKINQIKEWMIIMATKVEELNALLTASKTLISEIVVEYNTDVKPNLITPEIMATAIEVKDQLTELKNQVGQ